MKDWDKISTLYNAPDSMCSNIPAQENFKIASPKLVFKL